MIVVLIMSILVGVAVPSFREMFATQRTKTAAKTLFTAMKQARSEAMRLNGICDVYIVPASAGDWANGLEIQAASVGTVPAFGSTTACQFDSDGLGMGGAGDISYDNPLAVYAGQQYVLATPGPAAGDTLANIQYNRLGRSVGGTGLQFHFCDDDNLAQTRWTITLDSAGLPRYSSDGTCPLP